mmetsp:Transcript_8126/g.25388  ORF Transcript_8126/g.25388 Transcript_8126/m.25388 type:complete len:223 (+) Transcript_8126:485-1153(+)
MAAKWCDVLSMALAFDELPDTTGCQERECAPFARCVTHLCSLLHAVALHTLRGDLTLGTLSPYAAPLSPQRRGIRALFCGGRDALRRKRAAAAFSARNPIAVLGGVTAAERARLAASAERVHVVIGWLTRLLVRRRKSGGLSEAEAAFPRSVQRDVSSASPCRRPLRGGAARGVARLPGPLGRHLLVPLGAQGCRHALPHPRRAAQRGDLLRQPRAAAGDRR